MCRACGNYVRETPRRSRHGASSWWRPWLLSSWPRFSSRPRSWFPSWSWSGLPPWPWSWHGLPSWSWSWFPSRTGHASSRSSLRHASRAPSIPPSRAFPPSAADALGWMAPRVSHTSALPQHVGGRHLVRCLRVPVLFAVLPGRHAGRKHRCLPARRDRCGARAGSCHSWRLLVVSGIWYNIRRRQERRSMEKPENSVGAVR